MSDELEWLEGVVDAVKSQIRTFELILKVEKDKERVDESQLFIKNVRKI